MTAPMTDSPTAPPTDMKNCVIEVAAPRSLRETALWTAINIGTTTMPMPTPPSRTSRIASPCVVVVDQRVNSRNAPVRHAMPTSTTAR